MSAVNECKSDIEHQSISARFNLLIEALRTHKDKNIAQLLISWIEFKFDKYLKLEFQIKQKENIVNLDKHLLGDLKQEINPDEYFHKPELISDNRGNSSEYPECREEEKRGRTEPDPSPKGALVIDTVEDQETQKITDFLHSIRNSLKAFIEEMKENQYIMNDFEISDEIRKTEEMDQFDFTTGVKNMQYFNEGRKSYIRIINKKNWPPTMDDLLEYITIYSQMNSIKFASLNQDKYMKGKNKEEKKETKKRVKNNRSISKGELNRNVFNSGRGDMSINNDILKTASMKSGEFEEMRVEICQSNIDVLKEIEAIVNCVITFEINVENNQEKQCRLNYKKVYEKMVESVIKSYNDEILVSNCYFHNSLLKQIMSSMHSKIVSNQEDVIQSIEVLEYFIQILTQIPNRELVKYALEITLKILKGDFILKGEKPFKCFYCVVFYLNNGFQRLNELIHHYWIPKNIRKQGRNNDSNVLNYTANIYEVPGLHIINEEGKPVGTEISDNNSDINIADDIINEIKNAKKICSSPIKDSQFNWEFFDLIDTILVYANVVLNDIEIFQTPEIYSSFLRCYYDSLSAKIIDRILDTIFKILVDKNHRTSSGRYNAMFSKEMVKTFSNIFWLYCRNITSNNEPTEQKYYEILLKMIYHNILLVNDKTLCCNNMATDFDATKDMVSFFQMNRGNNVVRDKSCNKNIKTILENNPSIFDDLQICIVKVVQNFKNIESNIYKERMIQIIFIYVYLLICCRDQDEIDPIEIIITTKDYLFKNPATVKYGMLFFMLIFSDKYNKCSFNFKKKFIYSQNGVDSLIVKLNESDSEKQLMINIYLVCLICLETSKELKIKVISKIDLLKLLDKIKIYDLKVSDQKNLISYIIEMCCLSNEMLYFPIQDHLILKELFDQVEMKFIRSTIDNVMLNLSEFLYKDEEDDITYTENDFLSASQANFCVYIEDEEQNSVKEAFAFIESDFLTCMFVVLFQLDLKLKNEFLDSLIPLIEQRSECRRILSKIEILEFFLKIYEYHRDQLEDLKNTEHYEPNCSYLDHLLKLASFCLEDGITTEDDMYVYSLIKTKKRGKIDDRLLMMLCSRVEYCNIPNSINFKETVDSFGLAAFVSKGKALKTVEKEVCLSPFISNLPSKSKGYCVSFWFRLKKLYDNMNIISIIDFKGEKVLKINISILREFENIPIQDRLGCSNYENNLGSIFSRPLIKKQLEFKYIREEVYFKESVDLPFDLEVDKVYHFYCMHQKKLLEVYLNDRCIISYPNLPYHYPCSIESPLLFQLSAIDKSISPVYVLKGIMTKKEISNIYTSGEMCDNSIQVYIKDYKRRILTVFPDVSKVKEIDSKQNDSKDIEALTCKIQISSDKFRKDDEMPYKYKSHVLRLAKDDQFYIRLQPKCENFK